MRSAKTRIGSGLLPAILAATVLAIAGTDAAGVDRHYQCYEVKRASFPPVHVNLVDQFDSASASVMLPERLCAPADKNGEDPGAPADPQHLVGYRISYPMIIHPNLQVVNQFGELFLDAAGADRLLVPTAKDLHSPPPPLNPETIDHFLCYRVRRTPGFPAFKPISNVHVEDQFGPITVTVVRPMRLCTPVDKN